MTSASISSPTATTNASGNDVGTIANIYVQGSPADLEEKLRKVWGD